jgi:hypothetical protein
MARSGSCRIGCQYKLYKTLDTLEGKFLTIKENSEVVRDNDV